MNTKLNRRDFLRYSGLGAGALMLPWWASCASSVVKPDFTLAFLTDMHVKNALDAPKGWATAVQNALSAPVKPDMLITGGDLAFDNLHTGVPTADAQYALYFKGIAGVDIPIHNVMGNHDVIGIYPDSPMNPDEPLYGKNYFLKRFKRDKTYTSFDHKGWHFVLLDTVGIDGRNYRGWVDKEQLEWLDADLAAANKPTVVFGHIPLFTNLWEIENGIDKPDHPKMVINNVDEVVPILERHPVRLVMAGHLHINESYVYKGIEYANVGAVSGAWWKGPRHGCQEGYAELQFRGDQVSWHYVDYGWEPPAGVTHDEADA